MLCRDLTWLCYIHYIEVELAPLDKKMSCLSELDTFMNCFTADETVVEK